jgi:hypothetical protein
VRIDEIAIHPRDNSMILATHGRAIWILDHLEPIQQYAAARMTTNDAYLFSPPATAMYRRPARDRNYEFWGDQTFFGENPPQAARISWLLKKDANDVILKIADATGRQVREISGTVLANYRKAGIQTACWDLRVQPAPAQASGGAGGRGRGAQGGGRGSDQQPAVSPFGAGCGGGGGGFAGRGGGGGNPGPFVMAGTYTVSLVVDGRVVETRPLRVIGDPDVVLTSAERKKMFDMAMEMHDLQRRVTEIANVLTPVNQQLPEIAKTVASRGDIPADVKTSFDAFHKKMTATVQRLAAAAGGGGRGGRGGGATAEPNPLARIGIAKNGLMGGMPATAQTMQAYLDAKAQSPKALAEIHALAAKASAMSATLAKHNIRLNVTTPPAKMTTSPPNSR